MRLTVVALLALLLLAEAQGQPAGLARRPPREDLVRIELVSPAQARDLDRLGVTIDDVRSDHCIAEAAPELLQQLSAQGYKVTVLQEDISGAYYRNASIDGRYLTYAQYRDTMDAIAANNPTICKLETLGTSASGNLMLLLKISDSPQLDEPEPAVMWDANTHGDEKIGWAVAFEFVKYLVRNYGVIPEVTDLVNNREIWILPMFNPDGYTASSRYNGHNVDMNRNWGWMWGYEASPGNSVMSESEVTGLIQHIWRHPVSIWVSYHAGTEMISYPWSYTDYDTIPEDHAINWLSAGYSQRGNSYDYGQGSVVMYLINGSSKDLGYGTMGAMSWSIEVNFSKTPPASEIDPTFNRNRDAMLFFCRQAGHGINGTVTDSSDGHPLHAQIWLQPKNWPSFTDAANGVYHRFALPGTYGLTVRCPGYDAKAVSGVVVPNSGDSAVTVNVQLQPNSGAPSFGFRMVACSAIAYGATRTYPIAALGVHDGQSYQMNSNLWLIIDMDQPIRNGDGNDFSVYRSSGSGTASVMASSNWKGPWTTVGTANGAQTDFDLAAVGLDSARYFKLKASGTFMFDAIEGQPRTGLAEALPRSPIPGSVYRLAVVPALVRSQGVISCTPAPDCALRLFIFDALGRRVQELAVPRGQERMEFRPAGTGGSRLSNGVYFVRLGDGRQVTARFTLRR